MLERTAMATFTRWVLRHRRLVVGVWVALAVAGIAAMGQVDRSFDEQFTIPGEEAFVANAEMVDTYGNGGDVAPLVPVVSLPPGTDVDSPGVRAELGSALDEVAAALPDARIASYASTHDRGFVSDDGRTTFALVYVPARGLEPGQAEARLAQAALEDVTVGGAAVQVTGLDALRAAAAEGGEAGGASLAVEAAIAGGGALLVLVFVFASFMALVPLLMALVAIPTTFLLVWPLTALTDVSVIVKFLIALVGLAIAIDYALLVVVRWREERERVSDEQAVVNAMEHAGKAVVFSGTTVGISLLALVALPVPFLRSIGIAGMLIPLISVAVAITLLPVVLATVGPRLDRRRLRGSERESRGWTAWARIVVRRRWTAAIASTAVLAALDRRGRLDPARQSTGRLARAGGRRPRRARAARAVGHRDRPALAVRCARAVRRSRRRRRDARRARGRPRRDGAGGVAPGRFRAGHRDPHGGGQLAGGARDARPDPRGDARDG